MAIPYQLLRSNRRTLSIAVNAQGALMVRAPMHMALHEIEQFILDKQAWILKKQAVACTMVQEPFRLESGAQIPYLGASLEIRLCEVSAPLSTDGLLCIPQNRASQSLRAWRTQMAPQVLLPCVERWSSVIGIRPTSIAYTKARMRWGSMSTSGALRLNEALVHLPLTLIDYVVVHELCHRVHPNHSPAFHAYVRRYLPNANALRTQMRAMAYVTTLLS